MNDDGQVYLKTELIPTGDLFDYIELMTSKNPLYAYTCWDSKMAIIVQMVDIVYNLEKCGILHLDLSLENFVLGKKMAVIDFGMSKKAAEYKDYTPCGKPGYIAPELQSIPLSDYNPFGIDAYALGICVFYIVFGIAPYEHIGDNLFRTLVDRGLSGLYKELGIDTTKIPVVFLQLLDGLIRHHKSRCSMTLCTTLLKSM
jgi:serine/threonine protein kinase